MPDTEDLYSPLLKNEWVGCGESVLWARSRAGEARRSEPLKTGFSLSTIRAQTRDRGRITRGFKRNEPAKTSDSTNLKIYGNIDSN
jgi:hypothetical protein